MEGPGPVKSAGAGPVLQRERDLTRRRVSLTAIRSQVLSEPESVGARRWEGREETGGRGVVMCT